MHQRCYCWCRCRARRSWRPLFTARNASLFACIASSSASTIRSSVCRDVLRMTLGPFFLSSSEVLPDSYEVCLRKHRLDRSTTGASRTVPLAGRKANARPWQLVIQHPFVVNQAEAFPELPDNSAWDPSLVSLRSELDATRKSGQRLLLLAFCLLFLRLLKCFLINYDGCLNHMSNTCCQGFCLLLCKLLRDRPHAIVGNTRLNRLLHSRHPTWTKLPHRANNVILDHWPE
mmetsp:Transcript_71350/g.167042  ORF Transcript_71350/g.167042 Transcript_71350/m.167042 type:complete len:231 (-) Transcript_71350:1474-2166(-)